MTRRTVCIALAVVVVMGCRKAPVSQGLSSDSVLLNERQARLDSSLANPDSMATGKPLALWKLPEHLKEISGLVLTAARRLGLGRRGRIGRSRRHRRRLRRLP